MNQGGDRSADAPVTVTGGPITVTRRVERGRSGLTATYVLSTTDGVAGTRIRDALPDDAGDVEFHPEYGPHAHDVDGTAVSFETVVRPEAPTEVALRVAPADAGFDAPPTVDAVRSVAPARVSDDRSLFDQPSTEGSGGILAGVRSLLGSDSPSERRPPNETVATDADAMSVDLPSMAAADAAVADGADDRERTAMADGSNERDGSVTPETEPEAADADESDEGDGGIVIPDIEPDDADAETDDTAIGLADGTAPSPTERDEDAPAPTAPSDDPADGTAPTDADPAPGDDAREQSDPDAAEGEPAPADAAGDSDRVAVAEASDAMTVDDEADAVVDEDSDSLTDEAESVVDEAPVDTGEARPSDRLDTQPGDTARANAGIDDAANAADAVAVDDDAETTPRDVPVDETTAVGDGAEAAAGDDPDAAFGGASADDASAGDAATDDVPADAADVSVDSDDDVADGDAGSGSVAAALVAELEAGDVEASERERLREALGVEASADDDADAKRSVDVRLDHMQARVEEFGAYASALEGMIDDYGTADGFAARTEESLAEVDERLDAVREDVAALDEREDDLAASSDLDAVREEVRAVGEDVTTLREELADSEAERDRKVSRMQDDLDSLATDVRERQDDLRADLSDVRDEVRALRADVEEMSEMRERLAAAFGGDGSN